MDVVKLLLDGLQKINDEQRSSDVSGTLRGGSSGCITPDDKNLGTCIRQAHLRYKGISTSIDMDRLIMFSGGIGS